MIVTYDKYLNSYPKGNNHIYLCLEYKKKRNLVSSIKLTRQKTNMETKEVILQHYEIFNFKIPED